MSATIDSDPMSPLSISSMVLQIRRMLLAFDSVASVSSSNSSILARISLVAAAAFGHPCFSRDLIILLMSFLWSMSWLGSLTYK